MRARRAREIYVDICTITAAAAPLQPWTVNDGTAHRRAPEFSESGRVASGREASGPPDSPGSWETAAGTAAPGPGRWARNRTENGPSARHGARMHPRMMSFDGADCRPRRLPPPQRAADAPLAGISPRRRPLCARQRGRLMRARACGSDLGCWPGSAACFW